MQESIRILKTSAFFRDCGSGGRGLQTGLLPFTKLFEGDRGAAYLDGSWRGIAETCRVAARPLLSKGMRRFPAGPGAQLTWAHQGAGLPRVHQARGWAMVFVCVVLVVVVVVVVVGYGTSRHLHVSCAVGPGCWCWGIITPVAAAALVAAADAGWEGWKGLHSWRPKVTCLPAFRVFLKYRLVYVGSSKTSLTALYP